MYTLTTGSFRDLERDFLSDFTAARSKDPFTPLLVVIPSGHLRTHLQHRLVQLQASSILNAQFLDIYGLAERLLAEGAVRTEQVVREPALYAEIIRDLLEGQGDFALQLRSELHHPGRPLLEGLPHALAGTLRDLRDSGARVVDSLNVALEGHLGEEADPAAPTLELYARVYETLQSRGLRTPADLLRWAKEQIPRSAFFKNQKAIFFYGFYDLTGVQLDLMVALLNHPGARLYFPYQEGNPAYAFAERLLKDPALFSKGDGGTGRRGETSKKAVSPRLPVTPSPAVDVLSCSGTRDEVWAVAKKILEARENGIPYSAMLVTARSMTPYIDAVEELFTANHIPFTLDAERPVGSYPLLKTARLLATLHREQFPAETVIDILRSPYFQPSQSNSILVERLVQRAGIVRGFESWRERLKAWSRRNAPDDFPQAPSLARELLSTLEALERDLTANAEGKFSWSSHVAWGRALLERRLGLPADAGLPERTLWKELLEGLEGLKGLDQLGKPVDRERFLRVWEEKLEGWTVSLSSGGNAGVQVYDVMTARGLSFDSIFLMGMNEKSFPRLIREDPFLSDGARSVLARTLGARLSRKMDGYQEERLLCELTRQAAERSLCISYQRSDEEGKALVPSLYLHEFSATPAQSVPRPPVEKWRKIAWPLLTFKELSVLWNRDHIEATALYPAFKADQETYTALLDNQNALELMKPILSDHDGLIGPIPLMQSASARGFSPDSLKDIIECPFRYFAGKVINIVAKDSAEAEEGDLPGDEAGKLIHDILERFYQMFEKRPLAEIPKNEVMDSLRKAFDAGFASLKETGLDIYPLVWEAQRQLVWKKLEIFVEKDWQELVENGFTPTFFEQEVDGSIPALPVPLQAQKFHGRIDRIDLQSDSKGVRYRVVDYKTGKGTTKSGDSEKAVLNGSYVQLPIYMGLTGPWLAQKLGVSAEAAGASFYNLSDMAKGVDSPSLTPEFWQEHGRAYAENLGAWLKLVERGIFFIKPSAGDHGYCNWCAYASACRKEHKPSAWRSAHSRERQSVEETIKKNGSPKKLGH